MGFRVLGFWARGNLPQTPSTDPSSLSALVDSDIKLAREDLVSTILMNPASQMQRMQGAMWCYLHGACRCTKIETSVILADKEREHELDLGRLKHVESPIRYGEHMLALVIEIMSFT